MNKKTKSPVRIVLANSSLIGYPEAGGHWMCFLQYFLGLHALGHDVFWLELFYSSGDSARDEQLMTTFFGRMRECGVEDRCIVLLHQKNSGAVTLESSTAHGKTILQTKEIIQTADLLWNFAFALRLPLLSLFKKRVLIDGDPGLFQISAQSWDMGQNDHDLFFTAGLKFHDADCKVPSLGLKWHTFPQFVYLPMWCATSDPGPNAPFTTVTQWNWKEIWDDPTLSISKRSAYLRYLDLPKRTPQSFELAANIHPNDQTGDRELLQSNGWKLVHPYNVAGSPSDYQNYIRNSRAEFCCPKPIYRDLKTGWFSDRSAGYLASGRPVLAEDTGFSEHFPTGKGLLTFSTIEEAVAGVEKFNADYAHHSRAAREFAEAHLDSDVCLEKMLEACR